MKIIALCLSSALLPAFKRHKHAQWELVLNLRGRGLNYYNEQPEPFEPDTIFLYPPGVVHHKKATTGCFQDLYVVFEDSYLAGSLRRHTFHDDTLHTVETLMRLMMNIYYQHKPSSEIICCYLLDSILRILNTQEASELSGSAKMMHSLQTEIIQNFSNPEYVLRDSILLHNYSEDYVRRRFREQFGCTPLEYLTSLRINHAKVLLQLYADSPTISISEIAMQAGFYDASYFSRVFKKQVGITPHVYRSHARSSNQPS